MLYFIYYTIDLFLFLKNFIQKFWRHLLGHLPCHASRTEELSFPSHPSEEAISLGDQ